MGVIFRESMSSVLSPAPHGPKSLTGLNRWEFPGFGQEALIVFGLPLDFTDLFQLPDTKETHQLIVDRVMDGIANLLKAEGAYVNPE